MGRVRDVARFQWLTHVVLPAGFFVCVGTVWLIRGGYWYVPALALLLWALAAALTSHGRTLGRWTRKVLGLGSRGRSDQRR
jgi:hypothetical protein